MYPAKPESIMSEYNVYARRPKRAKLCNAVEEKEGGQEECCLVVGTPAKPAEKVYDKRQSTKKLATQENDCDSLYMSCFDVGYSNETNLLFTSQEVDYDRQAANCGTMICSDEKDAVFNSCGNICLDSVGLPDLDLNLSLGSLSVINSNAAAATDSVELLDLNLSLGSVSMINLNNVGATKEEEQGCLIDLSVSEGKEHNSDGTKGSGLESVDSTGTINEKEKEQKQEEEEKRTSLGSPGSHEGESTVESQTPFSSLSQPKASQDSNHPDINLKKPQQKPKRKKHRPKVVFDGKPITPKPATPKQVREKKPKLATLKQSREKKPKQKSEKVRKQKTSEGTALNPLEIINPSEINESNAPVARALHFQSETLDGKHVDSTPPSIPNKKRRSKRRRKLNWFTFPNMSETKNGKKSNKRLFSLNWGERKRRLHTKRPQKVTENAALLSNKSEVSEGVALLSNGNGVDAKIDAPSGAAELHGVADNLSTMGSKGAPGVTDNLSTMVSTMGSKSATSVSDNLSTMVSTMGLTGAAEPQDNSVTDNHGTSIDDVYITDNLLRTSVNDVDNLSTMVSTMGESEVSILTESRTEMEAPSLRRGMELPALTEGFKDTKSSDLNKRKRKSTKPRGIKATLVSITRAMQSLHIKDDEGALVLYLPKKKATKTRAMQSLHIKDDEGALVLYQPKKKATKVEVDLDSETLRHWNLLMNTEDDSNTEKAEENEKWEKEKEVFLGRVSSFNALMHLIQGDRGFRKWKGSVLDSVVGVFLTQNVSDNLSSDSFMSLAATFPPQPTFDEDEDVEITSSPELVRTCMGGKQYFVSEPEQERNRKFEEGTESLQRIKGIEDIEDITPLCEPTSTGFRGYPRNTNTNLPEESKHIVANCQEEMISSQSQNQNTEKSPKAKGDDSSSISSGKNKKNKSTSGGKNKNNKRRDEAFWEGLRIKYHTGQRSREQMDAVDWEAVRLADENKVAQAIVKRGQFRIIAKRIQAFLNRVVNLHKSLDLEWLRDIPPDLAKEYLLEVDGLGLKSVECIRLLSLENVGFPVDTNVGRIVVRLGWVPLQPLPEAMQIHLLEQYPIMDSIQKYLWPRLCHLDQKTLYELHYQMITFGKVFCPKKNPNCNACPMRAECRHFASAFASARLALPGPSDKSKASSAVPEGSTATLNPLLLPSVSSWESPPFHCEPIIEEPFELPSPLEDPEPNEPENEYDSEEIPFINLNLENLKAGLCSYMNKSNIIFEDVDNSKALVALTPEAASIPAPKLRSISRLRTEHQVYELPRNHYLLQGLEQTESDEDVQYHLAIWRPGETADSLKPPEKRCNFTESDQLCTDQTCFSCNNLRELDANIVRATLLIPCRVAMRGSFPLNGTYFQVNEVFADHDSSYQPLKVSRDSIYNLRTCTALFGTSTQAIFRGLSTEAIQRSFWKGLICVRGFDRSSRFPKPLAKRLHCPPSKMEKVKR